jgi:hypothetical protein
MYTTVELPGRSYYALAEIKVPTELNVRYMTIKEVQHFVSLAQSGNIEYFADSILRACIKEDIDLNLLLDSDRLYLFYVVRALTMGNEYSFDVNCEKCAAVLPSKVNIFDLPIKTYDDSKYGYPVAITLPVSKKTITMVLPTRGIQKHVEQEVRQLQLSNPNAENQETILLYRKLITSVDGAKDMPSVINFIDNMHFMDWRHIDKTIKEITPGLDLDVIVMCEACSNANKVTFSIRPVEFFRL